MKYLTNFVICNYFYDIIHYLLLLCVICEKLILGIDHEYNFLAEAGLMGTFNISFVICNNKGMFQFYANYSN